MTPQGLTVTWAQAEGFKEGGRTDVVHGRRIRHVARRADTIGGVWQVVGLG